MEQNIERIINEIVNEINTNNDEGNQINPQRMIQIIIPPLNNIDDEIINRTFTEQEIIKKPISKDFLETLEKKQIDQSDIDNKNNCSICMDEFKLNDKVLILPCGEQKHYFHCDSSETCSGILPWLKENNTCPICRYSFPIDNDTNDYTNDDTNNDMNHDDNDDNTLSEDNQQIPINNNQQIPINNNQQIPINNIFQHMNNMMTRVIDEERRNMLNEEEELQRAILNSIEES